MKNLRLFIYSAAHFFVDFACAFFMLRFIYPAAGASSILLYNFFAFALQMPVGLCADRLNRNHLVAAAGCLLVAGGLALPPLAAAVCAGVGNALFHVGGGIDVLNRAGRSAGALGIFVSPGAIGLFLGGAVSAFPRDYTPVVVCGLFAAAAFIVLLCRTGGNAAPALPAAGREVAFPLLCLFTVVVLRSFIGLSFDFSWKGAFAFPMVCAVALGKAAGGLLADRIGMTRAASVTLLLSALLFLAADVPLLGLFAVFLFNATMPLTLWAAARLLPGAKGFAFGALTFALFIGFLPSFFGWAPPLSGRLLFAFGALISLPPLLYGLRRAVEKC